MAGLARGTYEQIQRDVDIPVMCCLHLGMLAARYPGVSSDTICSIFAQENQYKVLKSHHIHKEQMHNYCTRYAFGEDVLELCASVDFPPCMMMRRMLELLLNLGKQRVSDILKDPSLLQTCEDRLDTLTAWVSPGLQQQWQQQQQQRCRSIHHQQQQPPPASSQCHQQQQQQPQQPCQCSGHQQQEPSSHALALLWRLQVDVVRCVAADRSYSPYCDMAKSLAGLEYEAKLYAALHAADVPYWSEQDLRKRGLFKTPDALLQIPICVAGSSGDWHVVHWIDSKASFGDDRTHSQQLEGQYRTYINRYGPGLVIYWFGFLADLTNDSEVHITDTFPSSNKLMQLPRLELPAGTGAAAGPASHLAVPRAAAAATAASFMPVQ